MGSDKGLMPIKPYLLLPGKILANIICDVIQWLHEWLLFSFNQHFKVLSHSNYVADLINDFEYITSRTWVYKPLFHVKSLSIPSLIWFSEHQVTPVIDFDHDVFCVVFVNKYGDHSAVNHPEIFIKVTGSHWDGVLDCYTVTVW